MKHSLRELSFGYNILANVTRKKDLKLNIDNILSKSDMGDYTYSFPKPHHVYRQKNIFSLVC